MILSCCKPGLPAKDALCRPPHSINITGNEDVPASTYAKVIVDTAVSLTGGRGGNPFFPTKAQLAIQTGFEILRHMEAYVTIPNIHRLLLHEEDANATIETLMNKGDQRSHELITTFRGYLEQPPEQLQTRPFLLATRERAHIVASVPMTIEKLNLSGTPNGLFFGLCMAFRAACTVTV